MTADKRCAFTDPENEKLRCIAQRQTDPRGRVISPWCDSHTHSWVAAAEIPLDQSKIRGTIRRSPYQVPERIWVTLREILCADCRVNYYRGVGTACNAYSPLLRGGPMGTRKRKDDAEDALSVAERLS